MFCKKNIMIEKKKEQNKNVKLKLNLPWYWVNSKVLMKNSQDTGEIAHRRKSEDLNPWV